MIEWLLISFAQLLSALGLERQSPLPHPTDPNTRATRPVSPYGMTIRPLLDNIVCPSLAIVVTNSATRNGYITSEPHFGPAFKRARRSEVTSTTTMSMIAGPSAAPSMATFMPSVLTPYPYKNPEILLPSKKRKSIKDRPLYASIAYIHASEIEGQVDEAVAERSLSTAVLQVLSAYEACGTFIASASFHTCWLRLLALNDNHVIMETVNPEEASQTVKFADLLREGKVIERFAWDLRDLANVDVPEPDMETIEQVWLAMYAAFRIAAEWPLDGPIPRIPLYTRRQERWTYLTEITRLEPVSEEVENGGDDDIRMSVAEALGVDLSPSLAQPASFAPRRQSDTEAILAGESAMGFREWARFFHSHPDLVALASRLDINVTFVTPSYLDGLIVERIPGYRPRSGPPPPAGRMA